MEDLGQIEKYAAGRPFYDDARATGFPLLRSAEPEAILTGYSLAKSGGATVMVQTNHVTRRLDAGGLPVWFSNRTSKPTPELSSWMSHAVHHVVNGDPDVFAEMSTKDGYDRLISRLMKPERYERDIRVDGVLEWAEAFDFAGGVFARLKPRLRFERTIAAPEFIIRAGFVTGVPD